MFFVAVWVALCVIVCVAVCVAVWVAACVAVCVAVCCSAMQYSVLHQLVFASSGAHVCYVAGRCAVCCRAL